MGSYDPYQGGVGELKGDADVSADRRIAIRAAGRVGRGECDTQTGRHLIDELSSTSNGLRGGVCVRQLLTQED